MEWNYVKQRQIIHLMDCHILLTIVLLHFEQELHHLIGDLLQMCLDLSAFLPGICTCQQQQLHQEFLKDELVMC